jgi:hypothetical protein
MCKSRMWCSNEGCNHVGNLRGAVGGLINSGEYLCITFFYIYNLLVSRTFLSANPQKSPDFFYGNPQVTHGCIQSYTH